MTSFSSKEPIAFNVEIDHKGADPQRAILNLLLQVAPILVANVLDLNDLVIVHIHCLTHNDLFPCR